MIQPLKDADGNYIPLDTWELYEDDGTAVDITGFAYVTRVGVWSASDFDGNILNPRQLHLNKPSDGMDGWSERLTRLPRATSSALVWRTPSPSLRSAANECRVAKRP